MTIEVTEFRCPTCGHMLGEKEYRHARSNHDKDIQEIREALYEELTNKHQEEIQQVETRHKREKQHLHEKYDQEVQSRVNREVQSRIENILSDKEQEHQEEIRKKDEEIEKAKLESSTYIDEKIKEELKNNDEKYRQEKTQSQLLLGRILEENKELTLQAEKMRGTIENLPPEFKGTAGEIMLFEDLHQAFPQDHLIPKQVGKEMPNTVQFVVTEGREKIDIPILWDVKTGETITSDDIDKAKRYKDNYNTDYCFIVTSRSKCITKKDSKNSRAVGIIGKRDGILLVHQSVAIDVAEETRKFITEKARLLKNNSGRITKQANLYDYITSPERLRNMEQKKEKMMRLGKLLTRLENYSIKSWKEQKKLIKDVLSLDKEDQEKIDRTTQRLRPR